VTATGALNENVITPNTTINDPGKITIQNAYFPNDPGLAKDFVCWKEEGMDGSASSTRSPNPATCTSTRLERVPGEPIEPGGLASSVWESTLAPWASAPLGIELPRKKAIDPSEDWKRINLGENWSTGDTYNSATARASSWATPLRY